MGSLANTYENNFLDAMFGNDFTIPATYWVALTTTSPTDSALGTEPSGNAYARVEIDNDNVTWATAASGSKSNDIVIEFPEATGSWGTITSFMIMDHITGTSINNVVAYGDLGTPRAVASGETARFPIGSIVITAA